MQKISVIVPIYHGKNYIPAMIRQVEACCKNLENRYAVELVLCNDDPEEKLDTYHSEDVEVIVLNTDINRGIQGARVHGLNCCHGEYVLFLDQDDKITPEYLTSQLKCIQGYDASVCRALHEKKQFYNAALKFEKVINFEHMLKEGDSIVSPGQVLIKKSAISEMWKIYILKNNGADDWLLWLCMMKEGKRFALNQEVLFEHVVDGANTSWNTEKMLQSELEVCEVLRKSNLFSTEEIAVLEGTVQRVKEKHLKTLGHFKQMFFVYDKWMALENQNVTIASYLKSKKVDKVAIYGGGYIGKQLLANLQRDNVNVCYLIDRNAKYMEETVELYTLEEELPQTDAVIITLLSKEEEIKRRLAQRIGNNVWAIKELLEILEKESND